MENQKKRITSKIMDQENDGRSSCMSTRDVFESSRQQKGAGTNQFQVLCGIGEMFVRRALHQRQTGGFEAFLTPQKQLDRPQTGRQLIGLLQRESIEEQRINYLCTMAQTQQRLARENHRIYDQIISQEYTIERNLQIASAKQHIIDFIQFCDICVHRSMEIYARTQYDKSYQQICDRVAKQKLDERLSNELNDLLKSFKLAFHVQKHLQKVQIPEILMQLKNNPIQDFAQLMQNSSIEYLKDLYKQEYISPIYSLQRQYMYFKPLLLDYLRKINKFGMVIPDLSEIDVNAVYPLPQPYFPSDKQDVQEGQEEQKLEKDVLYKNLVKNEEHLLNYALLLTSNVAQMQLTPENIDNYYKENVQDWIMDKQLLKDKETFLEHCWFLFQDFRDYSAQVEEERKKFDEEIQAQVAAGKFKKGEVPPTFQPSPPARNDSLIRLPDYFNIVGTKIILFVGPQRTFKSDLAYETIRQIEILGQDFTVGTRDAAYVVHHPKDLDDLKYNIIQAFLKGLQAPRYVIIDQCPILSTQQLEDFNDFTLELVKDQQKLIDEFIRKQSYYGFYDYFQSKQKPQTDEIDKNQKKSPGRGTKPPSASVEKRETVSIRQDRKYSGIYKIICFHISMRNFIENQYYRVYQKQYYSEEIIKDQFNVPETIVRLYQEGQITFVENKNQDFVDQYLNYQEFYGTLEQFYDKMRYGITLVDQSRVIFRVPNIEDQSECQYNAIKLAHHFLYETVENMYVTCYDLQDQQLINTKVLFKLAKQYSISYNDEVLKYQQQVEDIYAKMDPKKLKQLQTAAQGAAKGGKGAPVVVDPIDIADEKYLFKQLPEMSYVILPAISSYLQALQQEKLLQQEYQFWQVINSMQLSSALNKIYADERLSVIPKFMDLLNWKLIPNFEKLVVYGESVNPEVRGQEVILNDQALLMDQINKLNNKELQTLYTQIQALIKESLQQHIQINKKIGYPLIQNIDELIEKLTKLKDDKEEAANNQAPAVEAGGKPVSSAAGRAAPAGKGAPVLSISEQIEAFTLETDAQAMLIVLLKILSVVRQILQNCIDQRTELTRIIASLYGTRLNAGIPCSQDGKAKIPQKLQKQLEPQVTAFDRNQLIATSVDQGVAGDSVGIDKLLEVLQATQEKSLTICQNVNLQAYNLESQEGLAVNLADSSEYQIAELIDQKIKDVSDVLLDWCKTLAKEWTENAISYFKLKQEELEKMFVQSGSLIEQVSQSLENAVYAIKDVHVRLGEGNNLALQINYK